MVQNKPLIIKTAFFLLTTTVLVIGVYTSIQLFSLGTIPLNPLFIAQKLSSWYFIILLPVITLANLFFRFLRWAFLLRVFGIIVKSKELFLSYLTAFIGNIFPFYLPYLIRLSPLKGRFYTGIIVLLLDIGIDFAAIFIIHLLPGYTGVLTVAGLFLITLIIINYFPSKGNGRPLPVVQFSCSIIYILLFSVLVWYLTSSTLSIVLHDFGVQFPYHSAADIFALSQLKGSLSFIPAGLMTTGKSLTAQLVSNNVPVDIATYTAVIVRFLTFWFTVFISLGASVYYYRFNTRKVREDSDHFDSIAEEYTEEIPEHIRLNLLEKKIGVNLSVLPKNSGLRGLDIGCGQGWYQMAMREHGFKMIGIDYSFAQVKNAAAYSNSYNHGTVCQGSITQIPLQTGSLDFIYSINTFHHLMSVHDQQNALDELYRILKPGGYCLIHEMNIKNPVFRLYMSYLFPLIKSIDVGTEIWIKGNEKMFFRQFKHKSTVYQTFLPDFLPEFIYKILKPVENIFEQIPVIRSFSAHLCIILKKETDTIHN
ncbi:MAG: methyltransferase domain-containing protein [Chitinispirillaceae bacterium]|nr:methyltransferase domain-containing protein [Chitinispirillaceae bacterium]